MPSSTNTLEVLYIMLEAEIALYRSLPHITNSREHLIALQLRSHSQILRMLPATTLPAEENATYQFSMNIPTSTSWIPANLDRVPVRPTPTQITNAIQTGTTSGSCAICQDAIESGISLVHCHHVFHEECIRVWFRESPLCPVCRHDVRETAVPNTH